MITLPTLVSITRPTRKNIFFRQTNGYIYQHATKHSSPAGEGFIFPVELDTEFQHHKIDYNKGKFGQTTITGQVRATEIEEGKIFCHQDVADYRVFAKVVSGFADNSGAEGEDTKMIYHYGKTPPVEPGYVDSGAYARHPVFSSGFIAVDYLQSLGYEAKLEHREWKDLEDGAALLPFAQFDCYSFFQIAELYRIFTGEYLEDIDYLIATKGKNGFDQKRRLRTYSEEGGTILPWVDMPWLLHLDGHKYWVRLNFFDTGAIQGRGSYKTFCELGGIELKFKDNFSSKQKGNMISMYHVEPNKFDEYALGDLYNHPALLGFHTKVTELYRILGFTDHIIPPKLTTGAIVNNLITTALAHHSNVLPGDPRYKKLMIFCSEASSTTTRSNRNTLAYLSKVDGGRCTNNRPLDTYIQGVISDLDLAGCYGEGLRSQLYAVGLPVSGGYKINAKNDYQTLGEFIKQHGDELIPGLWHARVSTREDYTLKRPQDFLISWHPPSELARKSKDENTESTDDWWSAANQGKTRIYTHEVHHAIIQHDFIEWLGLCSTAQRKELNENLMVEAYAFYPKSQQVSNLDELISARDNHSEKNTTRSYKGKLGYVTVINEKECHAWYAANLGDMLVSKLLKERKIAKADGKKELELVLKLITNTVYGDLVSRFFAISNPVIGNNITARARAAAWYMEKGFHMVFTITDGGCLDVNRVIYPKDGRRITPEMLVGLYATKEDSSVIYAPLDRDSLQPGQKYEAVDHGFKVEANGSKTPLIGIRVEGGLNLDPKQAQEWINKVSWEHLQKLFPNVSVLHAKTKDVNGVDRIGQFSFENKGFFDSVVSHGSSNYLLSWQDYEKKAMRSYSQKAQKMVELLDHAEQEHKGDALACLLEETRTESVTPVLEVGDKTYEPTLEFLRSLKNPTAVQRGKVFLTERILKLGDYRQQHATWKDSDVFPGCSIERPALIREFSLAQFRFQTQYQYDTWEAEMVALKKKWGHSYEVLFLNEDGTLDFARMIQVIDAHIRLGRKKFFEGIDKRKDNTYRRYDPHVSYITLEVTRARMKALNGNTIPISEVESEWFAKGEEDFWIEGGEE